MSAGWRLASVVGGCQLVAGLNCWLVSSGDWHQLPVCLSWRLISVHGWCSSQAAVALSRRFVSGGGWSQLPVALSWRLVSSAGSSQFVICISCRLGSVVGCSQCHFRKTNVSNVRKLQRHIRIAKRTANASIPTQNPFPFHSFHSFIHSFTHSLIHSLIHWFIY